MDKCTKKYVWLTVLNYHWIPDGWQTIFSSSSISLLGSEEEEEKKYIQNCESLYPIHACDCFQATETIQAKQCSLIKNNSAALSGGVAVSNYFDCNINKQSFY